MSNIYPPKWPYDWLTTEVSLDPELIVDQGQFLLQRALNTRRLIAFVGSGLSAAYGRVTWPKLAEIHRKKLTKILEANLGKLVPSDTRRRIFDQLIRIEEAMGDPGDMIILRLQLCEQIWCLTPLTGDHLNLQELCSSFYESKEIYEYFKRRNSDQTRLGREIFRHSIKRETFDETTNVIRILNGFKVQNHDNGIQTLFDLNPDRPLQRSRVDDQNRKYVALFSASGMRAFKEAVNGDMGLPAGVPGALEDLIEDTLVQMTELADRGTIPPIRYFGLGIAIAALDSLGKVPLVALARAENETTDAPAPMGRRAIIGDGPDPIYALSYGLKISRYATTNYDLEIERFCHEIGFRPATFDLDEGAHVSPIADSIRIGPLGGSSRDLVLKDDTSVDLIDFATNDGRYEVEVIHLHGRATEDSDILITERDYQLAYIRDSARQSAFREGLDIAFGGNPVLFVGLGLSEGDVLRPLREFVSSTSRRTRSIIALRDATADAATREAFLMDSYAKYGAQVIHYGFRTGHDGKRLPGSGSAPPPPVARSRDDSWLCRVSRALEAFGCLAKTIATASSTWNQGRFLNEFREDADPAPIDWGNVYSDGGLIDLGFEFHTLKRLEGLVLAASETSAPANLRAFVQDTVPSILDQIRASILTSALNAKLEGVQKDWEAWWRDWRRAPQDRFLEMSYCKSPLKTGRIWYRNVQANWAAKFSNPPPGADYVNNLEQLKEKSARWIIQAAPRGYGKGHLYSYLATTTAISTARKERYAGQFFHNFSFSTEIASVWDALAVFLANPRKYQIPRPDNAPEPRIGCIPAGEFLRKSRIERLRWALERLNSILRHGERVLIAFNAADILFDENGVAKQGEIDEIFRLLLSHPGAAFDLLLSVREERLPEYFRSEPGKANAPRIALGLLLGVDKARLEFDRIASSLERSHVATNGTIRSETVPAALDDAIRRLQKSEIRNPPVQEAIQGFYYPLPKPHVSDFRTVPADSSDGDNRKKAEAENVIINLLAVAVENGVPENMERANERVQKYFERYLRNNNYAFSLIWALAKCIFEESDGDLAALSPAELSTEPAAKELRDLLGLIELNGDASQAMPGDRAFQIIIDHWHDRPRARELQLKDLTARDPDLLEMLLRHVAIIAAPVEVEVLAECPMIQRQLRTLLLSSIPAADFPREACAILEKALEVLNERRLVLKLEGHRPDTREGKTLREYRYQVHRSIQTFVYRRLGSTLREPSEGYVFAPSLFSAQTRDLPQLHVSAYKFIYDLVGDLIAYPAAVRKRPELATRPEDLQAICLRSALGIIRTLFSLGVVNRFSDVHILPFPYPPQIGYLEHHRLSIRWMISLANALDGPGENGERRRGKVWPPFYRDEIVWLYNECGVFSLAQGQCFDAKALFDQALRLQMHIDGSTGGFMRSRILINHGLCAIDRGRLSVARRAFTEVANVKNQERLLLQVANGYCALVDHISGHIDLAFSAYKETIASLETMRRLRPLSMFYRHRADLHRHVHDFDSAATDINRSLHHAEAGGHVDMMHYTRVAEVRILFRGSGSLASIKDRLDYLQMAEDYADRMDISRLKCEVLLLRAEIQVAQGEFLLAAQIVTRAIRIANLNGLVLRRIGGLHLLAEIHRLRGDRDGAARIAARAESASRDTGYHLKPFSRATS